MIRLEFLDVLPTLMSRKTSWILEQRKVCFWGSKEVLKATKYGNRKDKKIILSRDVKFDEVSSLKPTDSQQVESKKITEVSQLVESGATSRTLGSSILFEIPLTVTRDESHEQTRILKTLRIKDMLWVRSKILLQVYEVEETHKSPHGSL